MVRSFYRWSKDVGKYESGESVGVSMSAMAGTRLGLELGLWLELELGLDLMC